MTDPSFLSLPPPHPSLSFIYRHKFLMSELCARPARACVCVHSCRCPLCECMASVCVWVCVCARMCFAGSLGVFLCVCVCVCVFVFMCVFVCVYMTDRLCVIM